MPRPQKSHTNLIDTYTYATETKHICKRDLLVYAFPKIPLSLSKKQTYVHAESLEKVTHT